MNMKLLVVLGILSLLSAVEAWGISPCKVQQIGRKAFVAGAAAGVVIGVAGVAGAVVAVDQAQQNRPSPYDPPAGSMNGKLVLITGGSSGLGLESANGLELLELQLCLHLEISPRERKRWKTSNNI